MPDDDEDLECEIIDGNKVCRPKKKPDIHLGTVKHIACRENPRTQTWECTAKTSSKKVPQV